MNSKLNLFKLHKFAITTVGVGYDVRLCSDTVSSVHYRRILEAQFAEQTQLHDSTRRHVEDDVTERRR